MVTKLYVFCIVWLDNNNNNRNNNNNNNNKACQLPLGENMFPNLKMS